MAALRIRAQARAEIAEAFDWYLARSPDASAEFVAELDVAINRIVEAPEHFPVVRRRLRRVLLASISSDPGMAIGGTTIRPPQ